MYLLAVFNNVNTINTEIDMNLILQIHLHGYSKKIYSIFD